MGSSLAESENENKNRAPASRPGPAASENNDAGPLSLGSLVAFRFGHLVSFLRTVFGISEHCESGLRGEAVLTPFSSPSCPLILFKIGSPGSAPPPPPRCLGI